MRVLLTVFLSLVASAGARAQAVDIKAITPSVNLTVPVSAYNLATGAASVTSSTAISATFRSNKNWDFSVRAGSSTFTHTPEPGAPVTMKPVSGLLIRQSGSGSFTPLSTSNVVIATGAKSSSVDCNFDLRFDSNLTDSPGDYSVTLVFTLVTL
jgi:hypothetical protein